MRWFFKLSNTRVRTASASLPRAAQKTVALVLLRSSRARKAPRKPVAPVSTTPRALARGTSLLPLVFAFDPTFFRRESQTAAASLSRSISVFTFLLSAPPEASIALARALMVGCSNKSVMGRLAPGRAWRISRVSWVAARECPPRSKKLSVSPGAGTLRILAQARTRAFSVSVSLPPYLGSAATSPPPASPPCPAPRFSGRGNARMLILPFAVNGIATSTVKKAGTM
mmetsp:Transcript_33041/g.64421  ORF Transcript_33041/g.64421 Transcript_33041/m.64421 type:complete len:227 (+) Transcript_33041:780-1460(+)